jgi:hypothetical protein
MAKKHKVIGACALCLRHGELTEEHVPPRSAFNKCEIYRVSDDQRFTVHPLKMTEAALANKRLKKQGGASYYSLCGKCNSDTGAWYGNEYVSWAAQARNILEVSGGQPSLIYTYFGHPARFLKQVVTMFFTLCGGGLASKNPLLAAFILNRYATNLPKGFEVYAYYNPTTRIRHSTVTGILNINGAPMVMFAEMAFMPFGFVFSIKSPSPDPRLVKISHLGNFGYDDYRTIELRLPSFSVINPFPGRYFTLKEAADMIELGIPDEER